DPQVLRSIGQALAAGLRSPAPGGAPLVRSAWSNVIDFAKGLVHGADRGMGTALGAAFGAINQVLRDQVGPGVGEFLGDVFVYQRRRQDLQQRLWDEIATHAPGYGTQERPIAVLGHSLGGVIRAEFDRV